MLQATSFCLGAMNRRVPRTLSQIRTLSTLGAELPHLVRVPTLPFVGSTISMHSGLPKLKQNDLINSFREIFAKYGPFFSFGMPGVGAGSHGVVYVVRDPAEMMKVLKLEGSYPSGQAERQWVFKEWVSSRDFGTKGFYQRGAEWKRVRSFMQKDLLAPQSAREYLPSMIQGAAKASPKAAEFCEAGNLQRFLNYASFDMFNGVLFGGFGEMSEKNYVDFCKAGVETLNGTTSINRSPYERIAATVGYRTRLVDKFFESMDTVHQVGKKRFLEVLTGIETQTLTEEEKNSYFYKAILRQKESDLSIDEVLEIGVMIMMASVDTTASVLAWNLIQLAANPHVQDQLYGQILRAVEKEGSLTPSVFTGSDVPLLRAFTREVHRCTPATPIDLTKELSSPTEIYGTELPRGSYITFDCLTLQLDPDYVEDPMVFNPGRWLPEAVEKRKNTPAALIDHPFFSAPFSQGARRCPGSRVAYLEVQVMIAQLLLRWKLEGLDNVHWSEIPGKLETMFVPQYPKSMRFVDRS